MDVIFDKLAKLELDDAMQHYELQIPGLGIRFEEEVKHGIRRILEYPNYWIERVLGKLESGSLDN